MDAALLFSAGIAVIAVVAALVFLPGHNTIATSAEGSAVDQVA
jgi:hypothetical protein